MSGRYGICVRCGKEGEGCYTIEITRGWVEDRYNYMVEVCEKCATEITAFLKITDLNKLQTGDARSMLIRRQNAVIEMTPSLGERAMFAVGQFIDLKKQREQSLSGDPQELIRVIMRTFL